jgi:hypothetical protein
MGLAFGMESKFSVLSGMEIWSKIWFMLYFRRVCSSGSGNENIWELHVHGHIFTAAKQLEIQQ